MPDILTLREAAAFLRLSERSLYDLARGRRVPAALIGGKWLFPKALLERWLNAQADPRDAAQRLDPPPILAASHDPLLDWAVRQSGCGLALRSWPRPIAPPTPGASAPSCGARAFIPRR